MIRLSCSTSRRRAHMNVGITHLERFTGKCPCKIQLAFHALTATCRGRIPNTGRSEWLVNLLVLFLQCGFLDDSRGGGVVLVESGQHAERWIHLTNGSDDLPGVADGVDGVLDADDVLILRCEIRHQLRGEVVARPGWEVVQDDRQRRCLGHRREVALRAIRGWPEIVRGYSNQRVSSGCFAFRRQCSHIV